jgi:predicted flap endonuclease-1-like 5' DNA nuclease
MSIDQAYNFRVVSDIIATAGVLKPKQLAALSKADIEVVMNLMPDNSEYAVKDEKQIIEGQGIEYQRGQ